MLKNYFKIAWRNIIRHKGYSFINIAGLSVGVAACLLIFVILQFELSFNTNFSNYKSIYHVVTQQIGEDGNTYNPGISVPATDALRIDFPQVKFAALNSSYGSQVTVPGTDPTNAADDKKFTEGFGVFFMEPQIFDIFHADWLSGDKSVLKQPNMVVINKSTAIKYFGDWKNAMGKTLRMDNLLTLKVAGVLEDSPKNSDLVFRVVVSYVTWKQHPQNYHYSDSWDSLGSSHQIFAELPAGLTAAAMDKQLVAFTAKVMSDKTKVTRVHFLQALKDMHFDTRFGNTIGDHITSAATLRTLSFIGVLIIIMASINFINLSTAQSVGRSKEVGIRKVLGSSRKQLILQVIGETTLIILFSVFIAIVIAKIGLPYLKNIANVPEDIGLFNVGTVLFLVATTVTVILLSGIYPALVVSGFKPILAIKNKITAASVGGIPLRRALVVGQFVIAQLLIVGTVVAVKQMNFVNEADLGFDKSAVLVLPGYTDSISLAKIEPFKQRLLQNPNVKSVTFASDIPSSDNKWSSNFYYNNSTKDRTFGVYMKFGDADYFKTFGFKFVAGKPYEKSDTSREVVVNETLMHKLGIKNADDIVGKTFKLGGGKSWLRICGVVADFNTNSLRDAVMPTVILTQKEYSYLSAVKMRTANLNKTAADIKALWETTYPEYAYTGYFFDEGIARFYEQENQLALVYKIFAGIAIFISCLGLYGLVSYMAVQRTKEVGVRKVLGASVTSIVLMFSKEFMILLAIAFIIAIPLSWYLMQQWLQNFAYRIPLSGGIFALAIVSSVAIAWLTVGYKAVKAALVNPVKSLKSE
ncbi:ABC transporter permease [Mucilaginibacter psychrotolerans]|uniref:ABC transporter permease n=1 Tax=Mucilaginibacter psychrotolerans TaxID=1524096 RepID=A0A4Y8SKL8_9SPHI|nr:ABC transporter permease [Mucilaginibacter psychrotolerans]TFF39211.1 ABC transporter permease [Mucilaginibacter psychrotolerans]